jgi:hypothetical protein
MDRFWSKVDVKEPSECWEWQASGYPNGYGQFRLNKEQYAHRVAWIITNGEMPKDMFVCHKCDNRKCVNPKHLFLGTHQDNMRDCSKKGRVSNQNKYKTHCEKGHEYLLGSFYLYSTKTGFKRECKTCKRITGIKRRKIKQ